jgi:hypothetical protein
MSTVLAALRIVKPPLPHLQVSVERVAAICEGIKIGLTLDSAAQALGISRPVVAQLRRDAVLLYNDDPKALEFSEHYKQVLQELILRLPSAEAEFEKKMVQVVTDAALGQGKFEEGGPDPKLALEVLARRRADVWGRKSQITHEHTLPLKRGVDYSLLSTEELEAMVENDVIDGEVIKHSAIPGGAED